MAGTYAVSIRPAPSPGRSRSMAPAGLGRGARRAAGTTAEAAEGFGVYAQFGVLTSGLTGPLQLIIGAGGPRELR